MYYFYLRCYLIHMTQNGSLYKKPFSCTTFYLRYDLTFKVSPYQRPYISGVNRKYCLRPFPDRPDPISSLTELLSTHPRNWFLSNPHSLLNRARRAQRKFLAWFQTPHTVSRPSRPNFQPHRTVEHTSQK